MPQKYTTRGKRVQAITMLPPDLLAKVDRMAVQQDCTRSKLLERAARAFVANLQQHTKAAA